MDVNELAEKHWDLAYLMAKSEEIKPYVIRDFIAGYDAACEWNLDMSTAPKDGNKILIAEDKGDYGIQVFCASWDQSNFTTKKMDWCVDEAYYDEGNITIDNPVAWMPLPKYNHKP